MKIMLLDEFKLRLLCCFYGIQDVLDCFRKDIKNNNKLISLLGPYIIIFCGLPITLFYTCIYPLLRSRFHHDNH